LDIAGALLNGPAQVTVALVNTQTFVALSDVVQFVKISVALLLIVSESSHPRPAPRPTAARRCPRW